MSFYIESPIDRIVDVHWKKKDEPEPPPDTENGPGAGTCGQGKYGMVPGVPSGIATNAYLFLDLYGMYVMAKDFSTNHAPDKPYQYYPAFNDYVLVGLMEWIPFVWNRPGSFTVNYIGPTSGGAWRISVWYNVNPQAFIVSTPPREAPDLSIGGTLAEIPVMPGAIYPPFFAVEFNFGDGWHAHIYPKITVQAHCLETTLGALPPQPSGWGTIIDPKAMIPYPAPGSTNDPIRPPA